jgi:ribosomal protein L37AE/L43A
MKAAKMKANPVLACPVCLSDRLQAISVRMAKCESCGFIWNHEVSDRDNLLLILEHQAKMDRAQEASTPVLKILPKKSAAIRKARSKRA